MRSKLLNKDCLGAFARALLMLPLALSFPAFTFAQAPPKTATKIERSPDEDFWIGKFEFIYRGGYQDTQLEVRRNGAKLEAKFRDEVSAQIYDKFTLTVEVNGNTASFFYDKCLPLAKDEEGLEPLPCDKTDYKKGDLMFKLQRSIGRNKKSVIKAFSEKFSVEDLKRVTKFYGGVEFK